MAILESGALRVWLAAASLAGMPSERAVMLRESAQPAQSSHVLIEMSAEGQYRPTAPAGSPAPKPLDLKVETRFEFDERVLKLARDGQVERVVRHVLQAASAINGQIRPSASSLRPEVALLIASKRDGDVITYSPGGPLTGSELELVQAPGDPLTLSGLLPDRAVAVGDTWPIGNATARALSDYDAIASNTLNGRLEALDADSARVRLTGEIRGAARGGEGTITCDGTFTFNRRANRIDKFTLKRAEVRRAGPVEAGLDLKGTLKVERRSAELPPELSDPALTGIPTDDDVQRTLVTYSPPTESYSLLHDRDWHLFWDDARRSIFKRLDHGEVVAQCNLAVGPNAGKGKHQDPAQFRDDVKRALGNRFVQFLGEGEVEGAPGGWYRYKVGVQGREGDVGVVWYYYLVASPEGEQLLVTFTLGEAQVKQFGDQDLQLIGSLEWKPAAPPKSP
jgi:hypothetical protein